MHWANTKQIYYKYQAESVFHSCTYDKSNVRPTGKSTVSTISNIIISKPEDLGHMDCFIYKLSGRVINLIGTPTNCKYTCGLLSKDCFLTKYLLNFRST